VWAEADLIVPGDKAHLQPLKVFRAIPIVTPRQFVERFS
jgi:predicted nucleic acid-binding protein